MTKLTTDQQDLSKEVVISSEPKITFKKIVLGFWIMIIFFGLFLLFGKNHSGGGLVGTVNLSPTPFPFEEMTIPYLRKKIYTSQLGEMEKIDDNGVYTLYLTSYQSEGLKINGLLTVPNQSLDSARNQSESGSAQEKNNTTKKYPAIVFVHGYIPPMQYVTTEKYVEYVDYLARSGFVVFKIDLRGHGESEGQAGGGYFGSDYVIDTLNAYSALQHASFIDGQKIGMWGHSMAGNVLLRSAVVKKDIPAIVIWAGAVYSYEDQRKYGIQDTSYRPPQDINRQRVADDYLLKK